MTQNGTMMATAWGQLSRTKDEPTVTRCCTRACDRKHCRYVSSRLILFVSRFSVYAFCQLCRDRGIFETSLRKFRHWNKKHNASSWTQLKEPIEKGKRAERGSLVVFAFYIHVHIKQCILSLADPSAHPRPSIYHLNSSIFSTQRLTNIKKHLMSFCTSNGPCAGHYENKGLIVEFL